MVGPSPAADALPFFRSSMPVISADPRLAAYRGARAMVTGGLGFIGSALARRLVELGADVLVVDRLAEGSGANRFNIAGMENRVTVEERDVRDEAAMRALLPGCQYLFNLAAQTGHLESMRDPLADLEVNARAVASLLEACRAVAPEISVVFAGTRQVYGRPERLPVDETH